MPQVDPAALNRNVLTGQQLLPTSERQLDELVGLPEQPAPRARELAERRRELRKVWESCRGSGKRLPEELRRAFGISYDGDASCVKGKICATLATLGFTTSQPLAALPVRFRDATLATGEDECLLFSITDTYGLVRFRAEHEVLPDLALCSSNDSGLIHPVVLGRERKERADFHLLAVTILNKVEQPEGAEWTLDEFLEAYDKERSRYLQFERDSIAKQAAEAAAGAVAGIATTPPPQQQVDSLAQRWANWFRSWF